MAAFPNGFAAIDELKFELPFSYSTVLEFAKDYDY